MNSIFYPIYQAVGWLALYIGLTFAISFRPFFTPFEYLYGAVLIGAAAGFSHLMRAGFKRWLKERAIYWQMLYLALQSLLGGMAAGLALVAFVLALAKAGITDPVAPGQEALVFKMVFWGNAINMITALLLWSACYLTIVKARQLRDSNQALASSQMDVLVQQLSPHFLFNVLNNIRAMILDDPAKAREALAQLADMLRYNLQRDNNSKVSLGEELDVVQEYIALCQLHFEERLIFQAKVDPEANTLLIPRMLLQLCVENAIKHGISKLEKGGTVYLNVALQGATLMIELQNPCPSQNSDNVDAEPGIGLRNIEKRLALMYPPKSAWLNFQRTGGQGTDSVQVRLSLPIEQDPSQCA
ncbi:sensor histidine kinase [Gilvimarinus xylanilyticus]|uniref:Histidine kinase n=1 Tax=Gilvimarinus xylanilyticus TaxID=2944139 RepID=A0A9X2I4H3_9GAMM|nr:histidine kinase [Gilvimarinus xylanilyticus]MCP8899287.1 histidine kinase [Gilvimarinus xylanilyticus]